MSNVMSLKSLRNKVSRNGFDLSRKNCFTAKAGELLPVCVEEVLPGDKFKINTQWFTRTQAVNTAAYTRIREYYDWYFVPTRLLWRDFPSWVMQTPNQMHALALAGSSLGQNGRPFGYQPYFTTSSVCDYIYNGVGNNYFGYSRKTLSCKLLEYLGYGDVFSLFDSNQNTDAANIKDTFFSDDNNPDQMLNIFPLLAYQKIYSDYFRNNQWEIADPSTFNVDYISAFSGTSSNVHQLSLDSLYSSANASSYNMFDMRYCDWNKDYFMGLMPNAQYGTGASLASSLYGTDGSSSGFQYDGSDEVTFDDISFDLDTSQLSVLALRKAEALQRWKEISQSGDYDYKTQLEKHWNVNTSDFLSEKCTYLGGINGNLDISEVVNTNLADSNEASIAGKGTGAGSGNISYDAKEHGYIMCIYHCVPLLDYEADILKPMYTKVQATDYAIPEFDKIGMVSVPFTELVPYNYSLADKDAVISASDYSSLRKLSLGYAPRYVEYKTSVDQVHGDFKNTLLSWVAPLTREYILNYFSFGQGSNNYNPFSDTFALTYDFFKVNPSVLDTIFAVNANSLVSTDQFLINSYYDIKAVRNLDYNGLPY